jgi:hypothetical protein
VFKIVLSFRLIQIWRSIGFISGDMIISYKVDIRSVNLHGYLIVESLSQVLDHKGISSLISEVEEFWKRP